MWYVFVTIISVVHIQCFEVTGIQQNKGLNALLYIKVCSHLSV